MYDLTTSTQNINNNNFLIENLFENYENNGEEEFNAQIDKKINELLDTINNDNDNTLKNMENLFEIKELQNIIKLEKLKNIIPHVLSDEVLYTELSQNIKERVDLFINSMLLKDTIYNMQNLLLETLNNYQDKLPNLKNNIEKLLKFDSEITNFLKEDENLKKIINKKMFNSNLENNNGIETMKLG